MKPHWKDAPDWAEWLAMDSSGTWWWFEGEPHTSFTCWMPRGDDRARQASGESTAGYVDCRSATWNNTLEQRP